MSSGNALVIPATLHLPKEYGYVVLVAVASGFMLMWMSDKVNKARLVFNVNYPTLYSSTSAHFNCYQRAHLHSLEFHSLFLVLLLISGLEMPVFSALVGVAYITGKVSYAKGYYTGDPKNRKQSKLWGLSLFVLLAATLKFAYRCTIMQNNS